MEGLSDKKKLSDAGNNIDPDLKKVIQAELKNT
jgi:hypothetical protein